MDNCKIGNQEHLEKQLENFKNIAEQRQASKLIRWLYHFPLIVSTAIFICQLFNVGILFSYSRGFNRLFDLLVDYMNGTEILSTLNADANPYQIEGINSERLDVVDQYHEQLWSLFVSEVIELLIPLFNMVVFGWIFFTKNSLHDRIKIVYIIAPALALLLSISQACMIQISLADRIHHVRFILGKIISPLLEHNPNGSQPLEMAFDCQFWDGGDENGTTTNSSLPSCSSVLHDEVVSLTTLDVIIFLHLVPIVVFLYVLLRNLAQGDAEHLFLYVENFQTNQSNGEGDGDGEDYGPTLTSTTAISAGSTGSSKLDRSNNLPQPSSESEVRIVASNLRKGSNDSAKTKNGANGAVDVARVLAAEKESDV